MKRIFLLLLICLGLSGICNRINPRIVPGTLGPFAGSYSSEAIHWTYEGNFVVDESTIDSIKIIEAELT